MEEKWSPESSAVAPAPHLLAVWLLSSQLNQWASSPCLCNEFNEIWYLTGTNEDGLKMFLTCLQMVKNLPAMRENWVWSLGREDPRPRWRKWQPTPVFLPEKFHGQRSLAGYSQTWLSNWQLSLSYAKWDIAEPLLGVVSNSLIYKCLQGKNPVAPLRNSCPCLIAVWEVLRSVNLLCFWNSLRFMP